MSMDDDLKRIQQFRDYLRDHREDMTEEAYAEGLLSLAEMEAPYYKTHAIQHLQYVGKHSSRYGGLHHTLARLCYDKAMYASAAKHMKYALEENFADETVRYNYAVAQIGVKEYEDGWRILHSLMQREDDSFVRYAYAIACLYTDRISKAHEIALQEYARDMRYLFLLYNCRDYKTVVAYFDAHPQNYTQYLYLLKLYAASLMLSGEPSRALSLVEDLKSDINPFLDKDGLREKLEKMAEQIRKREFSFAVRPLPDMKDDVFYYEKHEQ